jgi:hypothetical protein
MLAGSPGRDRSGSVKRTMAALVALALSPACGNPSTADGGSSVDPGGRASIAYCTPARIIPALPIAQEVKAATREAFCVAARYAGPLRFSCRWMEGRTVTVNGVRYSPAACSGFVTLPNDNGGDYYFDVSAGDYEFATVGFWAAGAPSASGSCTASLSAGQTWGDRYNLNVTVTGSDHWRVTMTWPGQESMIATWNINASWPQANVLVATPNGSGDTWGVTIMPNGNWTWPTVRCETSTAPTWVRVQVSTCEAGSPGERQTSTCPADPGLALVGGGGYVRYTGPGALLTRSAPATDAGGRLAWEVSSTDHVQVDDHELTAYAVGLHLDGINGATLRSWMAMSSATFPAGSMSSGPAGTLGLGATPLGGGASASTTGAGQFLTRTLASGNAWRAASKDHLVPSPGQVTASALTLGVTGIIERFGALEVRQMRAAPGTVSSGVGTSIGHVTPGWTLLSPGGEATTTSGPGRMLFRVGVDETAGTVIVQSKDHLRASAGQTTATWIEARRVPGSHGLCNAGTALSASLDPCVAQICAADHRCCQTGWDASCVAKVTSLCGRSCADHTCSTPSFNPGYWNDESVRGASGIQANNNCYNYATNRRTDSNAEPGYASGSYCVGHHGGCDIEPYARFAINDGLIPTTRDVGCPDNRTLVALFGSEGDYHWYRRDSNGKWSHKMGYDPAKNVDESGREITDPETADRGPYTVFGGYFCVCSSSSEGQGHEIIKGFSDGP